MQPLSGPRPNLPRPSGRLRIHRIVYSITAYRPLTKARKRAKGEEVKRRMKNRGIRCLESWLLSIKGPPSLILWRKRGGRRVGLHSSLLVPWRGVDFGCGTGNEDGPKPLQTHRPQQANALLVSKTENPETEVDPPPKKRLTRQPFWFVIFIKHKQTRSLLWEYERFCKKCKKTSGKCLWKSCLLRTKLSSFQLFGESVPVR